MWRLQAKRFVEQDLPRSGDEQIFAAYDFPFVRKYFFQVYCNVVLMGYINGLILLPAVLGLLPRGVKGALVTKSSSSRAAASSSASSTTAASYPTPSASASVEPAAPDEYGVEA